MSDLKTLAALKKDAAVESGNLERLRQDKKTQAQI